MLRTSPTVRGLCIPMLLSIASVAQSQTYTPSGSPEYWSGNGHYYQRWRVDGYSSSFAVSDIESFARTKAYNGLVSRLVTFNSPEEYVNQLGLFSETGIVGASGDNTETGFTWSDGSPVVMYGPFAPGLSLTCGANSRLYVGDTVWRSVPELIGCSAPGGTYFVVEYEAGPVDSESASWGRVKGTFR
jgi:hypothetical protein